MEKFKNYCAECIRETNHKILFEESEIASVEFNITDTFYVVECLGCNKLSFRHESYHFIRGAPYSDEEMTAVTVYPLVVKNRKMLQWMEHLPYKIEVIYREAIRAFENNCPLLAATGFRGVIEAVCNDKGIKKSKDIVAKIDLLYDKGFLSKSETDRLHAVRFLGNYSIHEIEIPTEEQLYKALFIIDQLLTNLYLVDAMISGHLETMIVSYSEFKKYLELGLANFIPNDLATLKKILGRNSQRVSDKDFVSFQIKIMDEIKNGTFKKLAIDKLEKDVQFFLVLVKTRKKKNTYTLE